jgi:glycosyltransferase involved in cell wall biosynthesis
MMVYLSICIPTYNRKEYLKRTIESLISQDYFKSGEIEIVVSDNASVDGTDEMMRQYIAMETLIRYSQNDTNEGVNLNIHKALTMAEGLYRKVSNDTYVFNEGSLKRMVDCIKVNVIERPFMVFSNGRIGNLASDPVYLESLDQFAEIVSYHVTDDTMVGFWDSELPEISRQDAAEWFWGIHAYFENIKKKTRILIYTFDIFKNTLVKGKNISYGLIRVFYTAYFRCYEPYVGKEIRRSTYHRERRKVLYGFFLPWFLIREISNNYLFSPDDTVKNLRKAYGSPLVLFSFLLGLKIVKNKAASILRSMKAA